MIIEKTKADDLSALQIVLEKTQLFPPEYLPDMLRTGIKPDSPEIWLSARINAQVVGYCQTAPEMLTEGTWNMLAIAVHPDYQGLHVGAALTDEIENRLRKSGARLLIADTSGLPEFESTRRFYHKQGYVEEARIRGFWAEGDEKVTFAKYL